MTWDVHNKKKLFCDVPSRGAFYDFLNPKKKTYHVSGFLSFLNFNFPNNTIQQQTCNMSATNEEYQDPQDVWNQWSMLNEATDYQHSLRVNKINHDIEGINKQIAKACDNVINFWEKYSVDQNIEKLITSQAVALQNCADAVKGLTQSLKEHLKELENSRAMDTRHVNSMLVLGEQQFIDSNDSTSALFSQVLENGNSELVVTRTNEEMFFGGEIAKSKLSLNVLNTKVQHSAPQNPRGKSTKD